MKLSSYDLNLMQQIQEQLTPNPWSSIQQRVIEMLNSNEQKRLASGDNYESQTNILGKNYSLH